MRHSQVTAEKANGGRTDGPTDGPTDQRMDKASYRDAWTHLKTFRCILHFCRRDQEREIEGNR